MVFLSCSDSLSLLSENEPYKIDSINEGSFVTENEPLRARITAYNTTSGNLNLTAELSDSLGSVIERISIEDIDIAEEVFIDDIFTDLSSGSYKVKYILYEEGEEVFRNQVSFFYQKGSIEEISLFSYLQEVYPGSYTIIQMESGSSNENDPYIIWMSENEVLNEGYFSDGLSELIWKAPFNSGIYEITAYFYPEKPLSEYFTASPYTASLNIFVSDQISLSKHEISNSDYGFRSLFHFRGNVRDEISDSDINWNGEFLPVLSKNILGIKVLNNSLSMDEALVPVDEGVISPFSLVVNLTPGEFREESDIFSTVLEGESSLGIRLKRKGELSYSFILTTGINQILTEFTVELSGNAFEEILFSYIPDNESAVFSLFWNGELIERTEVSALSGPFIQGESFLGSINDDTVFHELGVYSKKGIYGFSLLSPLNEESEGNLFFDDFESMNRDRYFLSDENLIFQSGSVIIPVKSKLILELPDLSGIGNFSIDIKSEGSADIFINETLLKPDTENNLEITVYDTVFHNNDGIDILRNETNYLIIENNSEEKLEISKLKISN